MYSDTGYSDFISGIEEAKWYFHKEEDYFSICVFEKDNRVYQAGTEADVMALNSKHLKI